MAGRRARQTLLALTAAPGFKLQKGGVVAASLQGVASEAGRDVLCAPVAELKQALALKPWRPYDSETPSTGLPMRRVAGGNMFDGVLVSLPDTRGSGKHLGALKECSNWGPWEENVFGVGYVRCAGTTELLQRHVGHDQNRSGVRPRRILRDRVPTREGRRATHRFPEKCFERPPRWHAANGLQGRLLL